MGSETTAVRFIHRLKDRRNEFSTLRFARDVKIAQSKDVTVYRKSEVYIHSYRLFLSLLWIFSCFFFVAIKCQVSRSRHQKVEKADVAAESTTRTTRNWSYWSCWGSTSCWRGWTWRETQSLFQKLHCPQKTHFELVFRFVILVHVVNVKLLDTSLSSIVPLVVASFVNAKLAIIVYFVDFGSTTNMM